MSSPPEAHAGSVRSAGGAGDVAIRRVIVGIDDSGPGLAALQEALALARWHGASLVAVRAWALGLPRHGGRRRRHLAHPHVVLYFSDREQRLAARVLTEDLFEQAGGAPADLDVVINAPAGDPGVALAAIARRRGDVLVIGHGPHVSARAFLHGSVTSYCLRHAACPVVVVPVTEADRARHSVLSGG